MKRSEINNYLRWAVDLMDKYQFKLPRFAYWSMDEWKANKDNIETLRNQKLDEDPTLYYNTLIEIREEKNIKWKDDALKKQYKELMDKLLESVKNQQ